MMPDRATLRRDFLVPATQAPVYRQGSDRPALGPACIAIGVFDGLHAGHRTLIRCMVEDAHRRGVAAVVVTFDPDPEYVLSPHPKPLLMAPRDRVRMLASLDVDAVLVVPFTHELSRLDHVQFFNDVIFPLAQVLAIHVGSDFRLGAGGSSDVAVIRAWGKELGIAVEGHELVTDEGAPISATRIREHLAAARIDDACRELGRRYMVRGRVHTGRGEGTGMGFPTADIRVNEHIQTPADGVYAGLALVDDTVWPAAINVGLPPTFKDKPNAAHLEANLIGFSGDLYGKDIALAFEQFLRPSRAFANTDELIQTVLGNIRTVTDTYGEQGASIA